MDQMRSAQMRMPAHDTCFAQVVLGSLFSSKSDNKCFGSMAGTDGEMDNARYTATEIGNGHWMVEERATVRSLPRKQSWNM